MPTTTIHLVKFSLLLPLICPNMATASMHLVQYAPPTSTCLTMPYHHLLAPLCLDLLVHVLLQPFTDPKGGMMHQVWGRRPSK